MPEIVRVPKTPLRNAGVLNEPVDYAQPVSFSRGLRVELGDWVMLFVSGTASVNEHGESMHPGDFQAQARRTFGNIKALLASAAADWHDVVRTTCYLADFRYYDEFNQVRNEFYQAEGLAPLPASTCVEARLCRPELLIEIEALAIVPRTRTTLGNAS